MQNNVIRLADTAAGYIQAMGPTTPWEALRNCGLPAEDLKGDHVVGFPDLGLVFAAGLSELAGDILSNLTFRTDLDVRAAHLLLYLWAGDAVVSGMPLAKRVPRAGYKRDHFVAVVFAPVAVPA